ncbi:MAG: MotA/TolQ/ExbB proton channel family protein [Spirochaetes bacterium]|nr:MotA/TolQ/ExbB proton channel family protein [Spirochaetota bacterium]
MQLSMKDLFLLGGWAMWPLLAFSIVAVALILERTIYLLVHRLNVRNLEEGILYALNEGDVQKAILLCKKAPKRTVVAPIFLAALESVDLGEHRIERAMEAAASRQIQGLEKGFDLLIAIGSLAPITGFLGTVSGMITAFRNISQAADVNAQLVAGGIFEALITTAYGLTIAIAAIAAYNIFVHIVDRFAAALEDAGNEIITSLLRLKHGPSLPKAEDIRLAENPSMPQTLLYPSHLVNAPEGGEDPSSQKGNLT